jgi:hypothetical protein
MNIELQMAIKHAMDETAYGRRTRAGIASDFVKLFIILEGLEPQEAIKKACRLARSAIQGVDA